MKAHAAITTLLVCLTLMAPAVRAREDSPALPDSVKLDAVRLDIVLGAGELREPLGLSVDDRGFVLVADAMAGKVYGYSQGGESLEFDRPRLDAGFYPIDVAAHGTLVYVLDYSGDRVLRYDYKGVWLDVLLDFSGSPVRPVSLTSGRGGRLITTDRENQQVTVWSPLLDVEFTTGEYGWSDGSFDKPLKATFFDDEKIAVAESGNARVQILSGSGGFDGYAVPTGGEKMGSPRYVCSGPAGYLFVADPGAGRVFCFTPSLDHVLTIGADEGMKPSAVAVSWEGLLYVADLETRSVLVYRLDYPGRKR
jgi:hypothetical protein